MKVYKIYHKIILALLVSAAFVFFVPQTTVGQTEKLGVVSYTPVKGWKKVSKENIVTFSEFDEATGKFCTITLYGATPGTGKAQGDFRREWNNLVVKPWSGEPNPKTETETVGGWTAIAAGTGIDFQGVKSVAFLTVLSNAGTTVSVLGIFNDESYSTKLVAFSSSLDIEKTVAARPLPQPEISSPAAAAATMHVATLVKEFENNEIRANQQWVGKRVRVHGTVNSIEINKEGQIVLTFKSSISTYNNARCFFNKSQSSRVAALNAHEVATVEGTVKGLGGGFDNTKAFLILEHCTVP